MDKSNKSQNLGAKKSFTRSRWHWKKFFKEGKNFKIHSLILKSFFGIIWKRISTKK